VILNGIQIHTHHTGGQNSRGVINPGTADDGLCGSHLVRGLEQAFDVTLRDARGHGNENQKSP